MAVPTTGTDRGLPLYIQGWERNCSDPIGMETCTAPRADHGLLTMALYLQEHSANNTSRWESTQGRTTSTVMGRQRGVSPALLTYHTELDKL